MLIVVVLSGGLNFTVPYSWLYGLGAAVLVALVTPLFQWAKPRVLAHLRAVRRLSRAEKAVGETSKGLWIAEGFPPAPPRDYTHKLKSSIPVIVVANLKGGVGKTTTVANLIGHYGTKKNMRVLALDLDFQGSLSAAVLSQGDYDQSLEAQADGSPSKAAQLVAGRDAQWLLDVSLSVDQVPTARCIPSYYTLAIMENRLMVEWLIGKRHGDLRYVLAEALHDRKIQERFDMILVDAPPRLTTGAVQALCAATHVLIPTILDELSAEAAGGFVGQLVVNQALWPHLRLLGVFGNATDMLTAAENGDEILGRLDGYEGDARIAARDAVYAALHEAAPTLREVVDDPIFPTACFIPNKTELGRAAGQKIAYRANGGSQAVRDLSRAYDRLGDEIDRRVTAMKKA